MTAADAPAAGLDRTGGPVARLSGQRFPARHCARQVRLSAEPGALLVRDVDGAVRRLPAGKDGIARAVHVSGGQAAPVLPGSLGLLDLTAADGTRLHRLELADWVPEGEELTGYDDALRRSLLREVLAAAGLAVSPARPSDVEAAVAARGVPPLVRLPGGAPSWFTLLRAAAVALAVVAVLAAVVAEGAPALVTAAAAGLLLSTVGAGLLYLQAARRDPATVGTVAELRPRPAGPVTRRFLRTAALRTTDASVVVVSGLGVERHLPRSGPLALTTAAVVRAGTEGAAVELRTADGTPRASLPWRPWFGGSGGEQALEQFLRASALRLDRGAAPSDRPSADRAAALLATGPREREAVAGVAYPHGVPGQAAFLQTGILAVVCLVAAEGAPVASAVLVVVVVATLGVSLGRALLGRLWLDRPTEQA